MKSRASKFLKAALPFAAAAVFLLALALLYESLRRYHYADIAKRLRAFPAGLIGAALGATLVNYLVLTLYDRLALAYVGASLPYRKVAFVSSLSYVFSYNIGLSLFGSSALRYRYYSAWGLEGGAIARVIAFCIATFWIGLAAAGGASLLLSPPLRIASLPLLATSSKLFGGLLVAAVLAYLLASLGGKAELGLGKFRARLPEPRIALGQVLVAAVDWCLAAFVLYLLLPAGRPSYLGFLSIFMVAQLAGATSHVPGGIGVFETVMLLALSNRVPGDALAASMLAYRGVFYLVPLALAVLAFVGRELYAARRRVERIAAGAGRLIAPFVPFALAAVVFAAGALLLLSGARPVGKERLDLLEPFLPLGVVELSHFASSLLGLALLVVADALRRRVDAAYYLTLGLLVAGAAFSLPKGLAYEEAAFLLAVAALILPARRLFYRRAALWSPRLGLGWFAAIGTVIAASVWLGLFAYKHVQYSNELWWAFELSRQAPRFLRASLGVVLALVVLALRSLLAPAPRKEGETLATCEAEVRTVLGSASSANASLALLGDKLFRFGPARSSFIMYGLSGRTYAVMGDPVGEAAEFEELIWDFADFVRRQGGRVIWYEIGQEHLPVYLELGMKILKFGEEAQVELGSFSLAGAARQNLRTAMNKLGKAGYGFEVLGPAELPTRLPELRAVSEEWLRGKEGREKGFSLGFFDEAYLGNFPIATVLREGRVVAFANLWSSGGRREIAIDLMRYRAGLPNGAMEFLFVSILEWAKSQGYAVFSLGMAPLSGIEARGGVPLWNKAAALIFRSGEGRNSLQGLRAFKEKFSPSWRPRYLAIPAGTSLPAAAADLALLVSRGKRGPSAPASAG